MADDTDDWMNPPKRDYFSRGARTPEYPRFLIERKRRLDYPPFEHWAVWSSHDSREARDVELGKLRSEHPIWLLRSRDELFPPMAYLSNGAA